MVDMPYAFIYQCIVGTMFVLSKGICTCIEVQHSFYESMNAHYILRVFVRDSKVVHSPLTGQRKTLLLYLVSKDCASLEQCNWMGESHNFLYDPML
jgi:hypothetical protein